MVFIGDDKMFWYLDGQRDLPHTQLCEAEGLRAEYSIPESKVRSGDIGFCLSYEEKLDGHLPLSKYSELEKW